jgi:hypothetical protein
MRLSNFLFCLNLFLDNIQVSCGQLYIVQDWKQTTDGYDLHILTNTEKSGETEGLTFYFGSKHYDMTSRGSDILKIHQLHGCISLSQYSTSSKLIFLLDAGLPGHNKSFDFPLFCPFFNALLDQDKGLTGHMLYYVAKNNTSPDDQDLFKNVADDISGVIEHRLQTREIDRIYLFEWNEVQTSDETGISFQTALVVSHHFQHTYIIFKYDNILSTTNKAFAGVNLGSLGGWVPVIGSGNGYQKNWSSKTIIYPGVSKLH